MTRVMAACALMIVMLLAAIGGSYLLALHALDQSDAQWCTTLSMLTTPAVPKPADPAANPSRVRSYEFYTSLVQLEHRFGC